MKAININFTAPNICLIEDKHIEGVGLLTKTSERYEQKKQKKNDPIIQIIISRYRRYYFFKYKLGV